MQNAQLKAVEICICRNIGRSIYAENKCEIMQCTHVGWVYFVLECANKLNRTVFHTWISIKAVPESQYDMEINVAINMALKGLWCCQLQKKKSVSFILHRGLSPGKWRDVLCLTSVPCATVCVRSSRPDISDLPVLDAWQSHVPPFVPLRIPHPFLPVWSSRLLNLPIRTVKWLRMPSARLSEKETELGHLGHEWSRGVTQLHHSYIYYIHIKGVVAELMHSICQVQVARTNSGVTVWSL